MERAEKTIEGPHPRFLVIQHKMIGDVLTTTVACQALKELYPDCHVAYVANASTLAVLQGNPYIDRVWVFEKEMDRSAIKFFGFLLAVRKERFDAVFDAYGKLQSNLISFFARSPLKIAYDKWYSRWIYHENLLPIKDERTDLATAIRARLKLLEPISGAAAIPELHPSLYVEESERIREREQMEQAGIDTRAPLLMVTALGSSDFKTYPLDYLAQLLDGLAVQCPGLQFALNYMPAQRPRIEELYRLCHPNTRKQIFIEYYADSLRSFIAAVSLCQGVLGNEGGGINIGKALRVPTFCLFNPSITKKAWHSDSRPEQRGIHLRDFRPEVFENKGLKQIREENETLYRIFAPDLLAEAVCSFGDDYLC